MRPVVLLAAFGLLLFCFVLHALVWRRHHPKQHANALFLVFFGPALLFALLGGWISMGLGFTERLAACLLHVSVGCAYIQTYPALTTMSPTLLILHFLDEAGARGMTYEEVLGRFQKQDLFDARVEDLLKADWVQRRFGLLHPTARGRAFVRFLGVFRRVLGLPEGTG